MKAPRGLFSTRLYLVALASALILPGLVYRAVLLVQYVGTERHHYEEQARGDARQQARIIERDLEGLKTALQVLATSPLLKAGDLKALHAQATDLRGLIGADIELRKPDGQQLLNTRMPFGTQLPPVPLGVDREVIASKEAAISNVSPRNPLFAVVVPVLEAGEVAHLISASASTDRIAALIKGQLPAPWIIAVGDRNGRYVARSERHAEITGTMGRPDFLSQVSGDDGFFVSKSVEGHDILAGYAHTKPGNWLVAVSVAKDVIEAPLWRAAGLFVLVGALILILSIALAFWLWRFVARPLDALAGAGPKLAAGEVLAPTPTRIAEIAALSRVMSEASVALKERAEARNEAERSLEELAARLEEKVAERTRALENANEDVVAEMTRREAAEEQLRQLQKMEAIGQLTGGIAHDFNNMLAVIVSGLNLIERKLNRGESDIRKYLDAAIEGANRAAVLTSRLLAFSRQQALAPKALDANELLAGMSELMRRTLGEAIRIEIIPSRELWSVHADPSQLENAILNLAVNARDAMPEGGALTIETQNCRLDETYAAKNAIAAGAYVLIAVTDTGHGMSGEVTAKAFEPFFSTKGVGKGTGLGLSQVYGFVKQSSGHVKIYSEEGRGTTVKIFLPRFLGSEATGAPSAGLSPLKLAKPGETVLAVEDDERVRRLATDALAELGYGVLAAAGGSEALELLAENPKVTLLFTDIVMPEMDGRKLADEALRRYPGLKVVYATGFSRNAVVHNGVLDPGANLLQKPYTLEQLATKLRDVLDGG